MNHVTDQNFETEVLKHDGLVLVDFWAPWCGPCQMLGPIIEELASELKDKVKVVKLNTDENPQVSQKYNITGIPTVMIFDKGQVREQLVGFRGKQDYLTALGV